VTGRAASRRQHQRFCQVEGWTEVRNGRGKPTQHHATYEIVLQDGRILRTRVSRPPNTETYGPSMWGHILRDQLDVTEGEIWACVDDGRPPHRDPASGATPANALPASLAYQLVHTLGLTADDVGALSVKEAVQRMHEHWSQKPVGGVSRRR